MPNKISIQELVDHVQLKVHYGHEFLTNRYISVLDISRPGLELTGYFEHYSPQRIQLFGKAEISFAEKMEPSKLSSVMDKIGSESTPCFVISSKLTVPEAFLSVAKKKHIPILLSDQHTSRVLTDIVSYLSDALAERQAIHGVLVNINGLGVLISGDSGIGKSEAALELIRRGHRLVSDDRVDVYQRDNNTLMGESPDILEHLMEIRGIGIIDVMNLFGAGAIQKRCEIKFIVHLQRWVDEKDDFDRLGGNNKYQRILNVDIPQIIIPVKPGRNLAIIIESAAMNYHAKSMGFNATEVFNDNLTKLIKKNTEDKDNA
ncbi:MAG: HPr kinase/phosphorylase [Firmicutes bacterium]|uniref:HPr kinase/phosphorylase n=1 Tax=Candidatus Gallilactobacillus intestinavium TaxID=2840838 RepID=A0A9D9E857_9LACO|nr:HPr kinase/phosphorylase [Candidatus Gallilactobacillus intestinavium]